jgi:hypothetical protein
LLHLISTLRVICLQIQSRKLRPHHWDVSVSLSSIIYQRHCHFLLTSFLYHSVTSTFAVLPNQSFIHSWFGHAWFQTASSDEPQWQRDHQPGRFHRQK